MSNFIIDTNILISSLLNASSNEGTAYYHIIEKENLLLSEAVIDEYIKTCGKAKFKKYFSADDATEALALIHEVGKIIKVTSKIRACRDANDNKLLELAVDGKADFIITGDGDLLELHPYKKTKIITATEFLKLL